MGELPLGAVLAQFAPGSDDENGLAGTLLAQVRADKRVDRLYLPVALSPSGSPPQPTDDPLADAGYWHGTVSDSFAEAGEEASAAPGPLTARCGMAGIFGLDLERLADDQLPTTVDIDSPLPRSGCGAGCSDGSSGRSPAS
ncbi:hypothetical protein [Streptomyces sp. SLBN-8D4]|uniref:hypothetical protein n=1 Tax=Streptomyces sp. SLBN-8D4 TaxID=3377728 RepID=UPI003C7C022B